MCATKQQLDNNEIYNAVATCANTFIGMGVTVLDDISNGFISNLQMAWNGGRVIPLEPPPMCPPGTPQEECPTQGIAGDPG